MRAASCCGLLLSHPMAEVQQVTSERNAGKFVFSMHPNLRKRTQLKFVSVENIEPVDVLFVATPHGASMKKMEEFRQMAPIVIDLSADFRLNSPDGYPKWYDHEHALPGMLERVRLRHSRAASRRNSRSESDLQRRLHGDYLDPGTLSPLPGRGRRISTGRPSSKPRPARPVPAARQDWRRIIRSEPA